MSRRWSRRWRSSSSPRPRLHVRVAEPQRLALLELDDLLEALAEIELKIVPFAPAEMRRTQHVRHLQVRVIAVDDRLLLIDVDRGIAGTAFLQSIEQCAGLD